MSRKTNPTDDRPAPPATAATQPCAPTSAPRADVALVIIIALIVLVGCLALKATVLDGVPHGWDACAYYFQGQVFAAGRVAAPSTPLIACFWVANILNRTDKRFAKYPPGWPALLAPFMLLRVPQLANALLAACCIVLAWDAARRAFGLREARLTILLLSCSPFFMFMGANYLSHMSCATALLATLVAFTRAIDDRHKRQATAWGAAGGLPRGPDRRGGFTALQSGHLRPCLPHGPQALCTPL
ncbi:ArnT family glycosyltransferase [Candidatus Sumerlaeota bacterium]